MTFSLTKLLREPRPSQQAACELCAVPIEEVHTHVVDMADRKLLCTCYACGLLFGSPGAGKGRFKVVPRRYAAISAPLFSDSQWDALGIPIGLAFFFENSESGHIAAFYPGPAGATESQLPLDAWNVVREREPLIASLEADVEAVLVQRPRDKPARAYVVPIDACYELTGLVRTKWSGVAGGDDVEREIDAFIARVAERAA
jgi:hypothetical protein